VGNFKRNWGLRPLFGSLEIEGIKVALGNILKIWKSLPVEVQLQKFINLNLFWDLKVLNGENSFHRVNTTYKNYSLSHRKGGDYGLSNAVLDIKKDGVTVASIVKNGTNGYRHNCYGFYKDKIISGGMNGNLKIL